MSISERLEAIRSQLGDTAKLIAVSKTHPVERIQEAYDAGQRDFGESYAQELRDKAPLLPSDIRWHFLGALQRNKIKYVAPHAFRVHGITTIEQARGLAERTPGIGGLINVNLGAEASKTGISRDQVLELASELIQVPGFELKGLMCIPPADEEPGPHFASLAELAAAGRAQGLPLQELSMGMSSDWQTAVRHGAHWIRVGTAIFGVRT